VTDAPAASVPARPPRDAAVWLMRPGVLAAVLVLAFVATAGVIAAGSYVRPSAFKLMDWAISFDGGFVRRGLPGAVFGWIEAATGIALVHQIVAVQVALYGAFLAAVYALLRHAGFPPAAVLLVYSPFFLVFQVTEWLAAGRKEIAFIAGFAVLCFAVARARDEERALRAMGVFLLLAGPVLVLTHEGNLFYLAWVPALALALGVTGRGLLRLMAFGLPALAAMGAVLAFPGTDETVAAICAGLQGRLGAPALEATCATGHNAVTWLVAGTAEGMAAVTARAPEMLPTVPPALILVGLAFLPFLPVLRGWSAAERRRLALGAALAAAASLPLFVVAIDWGRFLYVQAVALGLVLLALLARRRSAESLPSWPMPGALVAVYFLGWSLKYLGVLIGGGVLLDYGLRLLRALS
jgi:hypothetical protein